MLSEMKRQNFDPRPLRPSSTFPDHVLAEIHRAADQGVYEIRGFGAKRSIPTFDDLLFLGASMSRYPLEGYRERCDTDVVIGDRFAKRPLELKIPITIAGMSFGALGANAKESIGLAATQMGTSTTTGDGGMTDEERLSSKTLIYQVLPSRYGLNPDDVRRADALEVVVGQGAKPGGGGMLLGQKITERVAGMRDLPVGIDQRSACRHPDWTGPDDLEIKVQELREITDWKNSDSDQNRCHPRSVRCRTGHQGRLPMLLCLMVCKAVLQRHRMYLSNTLEFRLFPQCDRPLMHSLSSICIVRFS